MGKCLLVICLLLVVAAFSIRRSRKHAGFEQLANRESHNQTWAFRTVRSPGDGVEDIRRFAEELFGKVIGVTKDKAHQNTCADFGKRCEKFVPRADLVAEYAYYMYHLIPPGEDEDIPFAEFKRELFRNLQLNTNLYNQVQDFRCLRELLDKKVVQGMKMAMIHAPGFEGLSVPRSVSDNIILYLSPHHRLDNVVKGVRACEPRGGFRQPPRLMRLLGDTGSQIAAGVDEYADGQSYGERLGEVFSRAYRLMVNNDKLPRCCLEAGCMDGLSMFWNALGSNRNAVTPSNGSAVTIERVTIERYQQAVCHITVRRRQEKKFSMLP